MHRFVSWTCVLRFFNLTTFSRFSSHIGENLYGEHTFAEIKAKAVFFTKFELVAFSKTQGLHQAQLATNAKIATESGVNNMK